MEEADKAVDRRPVADNDECCLCLAVTDVPLKLTSPFGRVINPFVKTGANSAKLDQVISRLAGSDV